MLGPPHKQKILCVFFRKRVIYLQTVVKYFPSLSLAQDSMIIYLFPSWEPLLPLTSSEVAFRSFAMIGAGYIGVATTAESYRLD